ncbi:hypothetical protein PC128_g6358 [Phytophthora cactorum]|nr:hypothetical protein PC128_g6358 [Phytophthora cactorum]
MIQLFYSDKSTVEKSQSFWNASVKVSTCLNETARLSVFRGCLKGKTGENRWMYSPINEFETLRRGVHNQFICHTPLQMIERLKNAKREKGISIEVWADLVLSLCDAAQCTDPQMRYLYFLAGLQSKEWKAALSTSMVSTIPQAVTLLLYKSMLFPNEDDAEFADEAKVKPVPENAMVQQMMTMMQHTQNPLVQQPKQLARSPWSPRRVEHTAAVHDAYFLTFRW